MDTQTPVVGLSKRLFPSLTAGTRKENILRLVRRLLEAHTFHCSDQHCANDCL